MLFRSLSRTFEIPFGWSADADLREQLRQWGQWPGREVVLRVNESPGRVEVAALEGPVPDSLRAEVARRKTPGPLQIQPARRTGSYAVDVAPLVPPDIRHVGGKAANFGLLRRVLPTNSPPAWALTFDLWDDFKIGRAHV